MSATAPLRLLVDTNVWIDYFLGTRAGYASACSFVNAAHEAEAQLLYPASSLKDIFYLLTRELKRISYSEREELSPGDAEAIRRIAWGCVDNVRELAVAVGVDESDLWLACKYRTLTWDLEDNVVLAAAKRSEADYLVTNDRALRERSTVAALSPADMVKVLRARA